MFSNEEQPRLSYLFINLAINKKIYTETFYLPFTTKNGKIKRIKKFRQYKISKLGTNLKWDHSGHDAHQHVDVGRYEYLVRIIILLHVEEYSVLMGRIPLFHPMLRPYSSSIF